MAEEIHDAIDLASVIIERQTAVGDGDPMTCWENDINTDNDIASYILFGGLGVCDLKIVLVIGETQDERTLYEKIVLLNSQKNVN